MAATAELVVAFSAKIDGFESSLRRVTQRMDELEQKAKSTNAALSKNQDEAARSFLGLAQAVNTSVRAFIGLAIIREVGQGMLSIALVADGVAASLIRLQFILGGSSTQARTTFDEIAAISTRTGAPVNDLTDAFVRFRTALNSVGASNAQVNELVETLANFGRISGARPQEAANAIIQLGQGLASGRLQGDELRSILENLPALAVELARELGVTVGELRKMGEEGRLTAENVFPALLRAGERLKTQLNGIPLTLTQAFVTVQTAFTQLIAHIDREIGASQRLLGLLNLARNGLDFLRTATGGATAAETSAAADLAINRAEARLAEIRRQLNEGQLRPDVSIGGMVGAPDRQGISESTRRSLLESERATQRELQELRQAGMLAARDADDQEAAQRARAASEGNRARTAQSEADNRTQVESLDRRARLRGEATEAERTATRIARDGQLRDANGQAQTLEARLEQIRNKLREDIEAIDRADRAGGEAASRRAAAAAARQQRQREEDARERQSLVDSITGGDVGGVRRFNERVNSIFQVDPGSRVGSAFDVFVGRIREGTQSLDQLFGFVSRGAEEAGQAMTRAGENPADAIQALNDQMKSLRDTLVGLGLPAADVDKAMQTALDRSTRRIEEFRERATSTFLDIGRKATDTFAKDLASGIVDFATTGEQKFAEMAANFTKMVAKMILEFLILEAIILGVSAATGGSINLRPSRRQSGGPVSAGQPYIVGERRAELFVPSSAGYIYPSVDSGGGGTTVNVYNQAAGTTTRQQERTNGLGGKEIDIYIEQIVQRGISNGRFDSAMGQSFGASRAGRV